MNIYIANLRSAIGNKELAELFSPFGEVKSAEIVKDVFTGQSRGFGYVQMDDETSAKRSIETLNQTEVDGLIISVEEAPAKTEQKGSYKVGQSSVPGFRFRKN